MEKRCKSARVLVFFCINVLLTKSLSVEQGCSFVKGECVYNVQLGHSTQCDVSSSSLAEELKSIRTQMSEMKLEVEVIQEKLKTLEVSNRIHETDAVSVDSSNREGLINLLKEKEKELTRSQEEITDLSTALVSANKGLETCHVALGVSKTEITTVNPTTNTHLSFCDFTLTNRDCQGYNIVDSNSTKMFSLISDTRKNWKKHTGPPTEHTYGIPNGYYMAVNTVALAYSRQKIVSYGKAILRSPEFEPADAYCVFFYYSMIGRDVGSIKVLFKTESAATGHAVFYKKGSQNSYWQLGKIDLSSEYTKSSPFLLDFDVRTDVYTNKARGRTYYEGEDEYGETAVDDVYIYNTSCSNVALCPSFGHSKTIHNKTSCYTFHANPLSWYNAFDVCRRESPYGSLVSIESQEEQDLLVDMINSDPALSAVGEFGFYTSGTDSYQEGAFAWTDTGYPRFISADGVFANYQKFTKVDLIYEIEWKKKYETVSYMNWGEKQPNNVAGNQNCLLMEYKTQNYTWGDVECLSKHPFICEHRETLHLN